VIALWAGLGNTAAILGSIIVVMLTLWMYFFTALRIEISNQELRVARSHIDRKFLGKVTSLDATNMSHHLRAGINPSAFHAVRFWVKTGVKIEINDPRDPTPYWLVSSRQAIDLARFLENI
jgi:hypothetical protein